MTHWKHNYFRFNTILLLLVLLISCGKNSRDIDSDYAGSMSCKPCHEKYFELWAISNHALAERTLDSHKFRKVFSPKTTVTPGTQTTELNFVSNQCQILTMGIMGEKEKYIPERVVGVDPIVQFLIPDRGGRFQVSEVAYHPNAGEWFNVFGDEDRMPGEWGHWTGRGMNWNSRCAACHNTGVKKNYIDSTDTYSTTMMEMGIGCEACHGGLADHVIWQKDHSGEDITDTTVQLLENDQIMDLCASCHSRRTEITGDFVPGDKFLDHYIPIIPDETDIYFPDGQVNGENYESVSFFGSKMYDAKVSCRDCHAKGVMEKGNDLCNKCHDGKKAPLGSHSYHPEGTPGSYCVDCHMPETVFMQQDHRHDHGFTIPDPELTKNYGVPNACNRCHKDKSVDWSIDFVLQRYGDTSQRYSKQRARWIAKAREQDDSVVNSLKQMAQREKNAYWRAVAVGLLKNWINDPDVFELIAEKSKDEHPLVRINAARSLEPLVEMDNPMAIELLQNSLSDSMRSVRVEAAWALRSILDFDSSVGKELVSYLQFNADQPTGALRLGILFMGRGDASHALSYLERATLWDPNSAPLRYAYAIGLGKAGQAEKAVEQLEKACSIDPEDANLWFYFGLALNETIRLDEAAESFKYATDLNPNFIRAWYNLGLAYRDLNQPEKAVLALENAESLDPKLAYIPYARATILADMNQLDEAKKAVKTALGIDTTYQQALHLLGFITQKEKNRLN